MTEYGSTEPTAEGTTTEGVPILERDRTNTEGTISMETSDVTAWCPYEGTADYYTVAITYRPEAYVVELMSLREYFQSYREQSIGHEEFAQRVFDHLTDLLDPAWLRVVVDAPPRYGIETRIVHDTRPSGATETASAEAGERFPDEGESRIEHNER